METLVVKRLYVAPVPHVEELRVLLSLLEDYSIEKTAILTMLDVFPRPAELCNMSWNKVFLDQSKSKVVKLRHYVYKARGYIRQSGKVDVYKEVEKKINSEYFKKYLLEYYKRTGGFYNNKVFSWNTPDGLSKVFSVLRKKAKEGQLSDNCLFLLDKCDITLNGTDKTQYRVQPYSLRRFSLSFHYYITFNQDVVALARISGHCNPATLLKHYIMPKEAIGLTQKMINDKITMDEFIRFKGKSQVDLWGYFDINNLPTEENISLTEFMKEKEKGETSPNN